MATCYSYRLLAVNLFRLLLPQHLQNSLAPGVPDVKISKYIDNIHHRISHLFNSLDTMQLFVTCIDLTSFEALYPIMANTLLFLSA